MRLASKSGLAPRILNEGTRDGLFDLTAEIELQLVAAPIAATERNGVSTIENLKSAFAEGMEVSPDNVRWDTLAYRGIPEWDSVAHMQVIAEIEDAFDIMIDTDDVIAMTSFKVAQDILTRYGIAFD